MSISTQEEVVRVAFRVLKEGCEAIWSGWSPFRAGGPDGGRFRKGRRGSKTGSHGVRWDAAQDRAHPIAVRGLVQLGNGLGGVRNAGEGDVRPVSDPVQEDGVVCPREGRPEVVTRGLPGQKRQAGAVREPQPGMPPLQEGEQKAGAEGVVPGGASLSSRTEQADPGPPRQGAAECRRGVADAGGEDRNPRFRSPQESLRAVGRGHDGARAGRGELPREVQGRVSEVEPLRGYGVFLSHQEGVSAFLLQIVRQAPRRVRRSEKQAAR